MYKFTLKKSYSCYLPFSSEFENEWIRIKGSKMTINKGYSWDGCSPKVEVLDLIIGTPDGRDSNGFPITYFASLVHDALYQWKGEHGIKRKEADKLFLTMLKGFKLKWIYYLVVRAFGGIYGTWTYKKY